MKRRNFLLSTAKLGLGALLLPSFLSSCAEDTLFEDINYDGKVVIIGAGVAGLYAGYLLKQYGIDFTILEASALVGGRVGKKEGFADFPIDTGGQWLHGDFSILGDLAKSSNTKTFADNSETVFWHRGELKEDLPSELQDILTNLESNSDISLEEQYYNLGGREADFSLLTAVASEVGASPANISAKWETKGYELQTYGTDDHKFTKTFFDLINDTIISKINQNIQVNTIVKNIEYSSSNIAITTDTGEVLNADKVIVTVPITVLKDGDITFSPPLPTPKTQSFQELGMEAGIKAFIRFSQKFMPASVMGGKVCASYVVESYNRNSDDLVIFGFLMGYQAKALSDMGEEAALQSMLQELDEIFDGAASASYVSHSFHDAYKHPFIRGAYSYPLVGSDENTRKNIAKSVDNKLFFAGEATNYNGHHQTIHGAVETGYREVINILNAL